MDIKEKLLTNYRDFYKDEYIYEKDSSGKYINITYGKFIEDTFGIANYLLNNGFKDKIIMIISENSINLMELDYAITFFAGVSVIVSKEWKVKDLIGGIEEIHPDCIFYSKRYNDLISDLLKEVNIKSYSIEEDVKKDFKEEYLNLSIKDMEELTKIVFSSGTTGKSKGAKLCLKNIMAGYNCFTRRCPFTHKDSTYLFLPLNHTYSVIYNFIYSTFIGYKIYLASITKNIAKELLETNPTIFCGVPLIFERLLEAYGDNIGKAFGKNMKWLFSGGALISKEIRKKYKEQDFYFLQAYALTETASSLTIECPNRDDLESSGEVFEDIDVKVFEPDENGVGEIIVKGDNVFMGYTDEELNKLVFDENGYFHTGDLGLIKDSKVYLKGRKKKILLTSNGENVSADKVEKNIKDRSGVIKEVKAYVKDDKIAVIMYVNGKDDFEKIILFGTGEYSKLKN